MKLIVGLGNPGPEYATTPHNAGFMAIDRIARLCDVQVTNFRGRAMTAKTRLMGHEVLLAKPGTFMNLSGLSVAALLKELGLGVEDLIVLYDELAFPLGTLRLAERGSAAGHNGVKSISAELGTQDWFRVRIGVGKPPLESGRVIKAGGKDFLLAPMRKQELAELDEVLDRAVRAVEVVLTKGVSAAMNEFNRKVEPEST
ncbi:aminoacyl-tRNA hydrolase [Granulicella paludicola]|jgi:PTH1 family peptidyl-tRNA hydrolase|uniref:aminoacyl-tRNA hydrolase n=1 Tax=Granulicella paludicola TaxID=474951 RepID=UPI0021E0C4EF|nr:aminoacyl-tRNA hydrolase [Granulicella paludicola]